MRTRLYLVLFFLLWAVAASGCGDGDRNTPPAAPTVTPAAKFDETHGGKTVTPHGIILEGSAQDMEDGAVRYQTEDGSSWKVDPHPNGTYGTPEEVQ